MDLKRGGTSTFEELGAGVPEIATTEDITTKILNLFLEDRRAVPIGR